MKKNKDWRGLAGRLGKKLWASLSNNLWLKLLSVVLALFLWSYVISTTPSTVSYTHLDVYKRQPMSWA